MQEKIPFLGKGWSFPPTFNKAKKGVEMVTDERDIEQSLTILLSTGVGERVMQHKYGCNMTRLLFEPLDTTLQAYMQDLVKTAILYYEARILLNEVRLDPVVEEGKVLITVDYTIAGTNSRYNFVYPYYKEEGINILP